MEKIIIIGGEGNGGVIASAIESNISKGIQSQSVLGFLNDIDQTEICGYKVLGKTRDYVNFLHDKEVKFIFAIHLVGNSRKSSILYQDLNIMAERLATVIHHSAFISESAQVGSGSFVMANTYLGPQVRVGESVLIMANSIVGHNTTIGSLSHLSAGSVVSSYVKMGYSADIGLGAIVLEKLVLGDHAFAGAGSLVTKSIPSSEIHVGVPAKFLKKVP